MNTAFIKIIAVASLFSSDLFATSKICPTCPPTKNGDIVHRSSDLSGAYVGHAGIYLDSKIYHVVPGRDSQEDALISTGKSVFLDGQKFWGAKRHKNASKGLSSDQVEKIRKRIDHVLSYGVVYDTDHREQKGVFHDDDFSKNKQIKKRGYWEFDCVGFVEHLYEEILNLNLVPNSNETGAGWPLTVYEQRDSDYVVHTPVK